MSITIVTQTDEFGHFYHSDSIGHECYFLAHDGTEYRGCGQHDTDHKLTTTTKFTLVVLEGDDCSKQDLEDYADSINVVIPPDQLEAVT